MQGKELLSLLGSSQSLNFVLEPYIYLGKLINDGILLKRRTLRNTVEASFITIALVLGGIVLPLLIENFNSFLTNIGNSFGIPNNMIGVFNFWAGSFALGYPATFITSAFVRLIYSSNCVYGDPDYYLNKERLSLITKATHLNEMLVRNVFNSLVHKYRSPIYSTRGERDQDLKESLEVLMFADLATTIKFFNVELMHYQIQMWRLNIIHTVIDQSELRELSKKLELSETELNTILNTCKAEIQKDSSLELTEAKAYYKIIQQIRFANKESLNLFRAKQDSEQTSNQIQNKNNINYVAPLSFINGTIDSKSDPAAVVGKEEIEIVTRNRPSLI